MATYNTRSKNTTNYLPIPSTSSHDTTVTIVGRTKTFAGLELLEWSFLVVAFLSILTTLGVTIFRLVTFIEEDSTDNPRFTLTIVILINTGFCLLYVINGILREKEFEIYAYIAATSLLLAYFIIDFIVKKDHRTPEKIVRLAVGCCLIPVNVIFGILVARRFGWLEFKIVGASEAMQYMYRESSRYTSLLKFDLQAFLTVLALVLDHGTHVSGNKVMILVIGVPFSLIWCFIGWFSMRHELVLGAVVFGILGVVAPACAILNLWWIYNGLCHHPEQEGMGKRMLCYATLAADAIFLCVRAILFFELYRVCRNFKQGLKERAFDVDERTSLLTVPSRR